MGLSISRYWGREPHWFENLSYDMRLELVADYMLSHEDGTDSKSQASQARVEAFRAQRRVYMSEGVKDD